MWLSIDEMQQSYSNPTSIDTIIRTGLSPSMIRFSNRKDLLIAVSICSTVGTLICIAIQNYNSTANINFKCNALNCFEQSLPLPFRFQKWALFVSLAVTMKITVVFFFLRLIKCFSSAGKSFNIEKFCFLFF